LARERELRAKEIEDERARLKALQNESALKLSEEQERLRQ